MHQAILSLTQLYETGRKEGKRVTNKNSEKFESVLQRFQGLTVLVAIKPFEVSKKKGSELIGDRLLIRVDADSWKGLMPALSPGIENLRKIKGMDILEGKANSCEIT